ncbi:MAG: hypothetical protein HY721_05685 [Planctomycetes bacterium]|nr:hypothetical protein [Planctomycetota bacterium]
MKPREVVRRAIAFQGPPRLPFWQHQVADAPDDVADVWEMDRARAGWYFDRAAPDDWGCLWARTDLRNMGQVVGHPLADASALAGYRPPDPRDPFYILHSDGRVNALVPRFIELGADVLNLQQPRACGLVEIGEAFRGKVCFLTTADIQATLPRGDEEAVREEARLLVRHWGTRDGGLIVFNYGDGAAIGATPETTRVMFEEFVRLMGFWERP